MTPPATYSGDDLVLAVPWKTIATHVEEAYRPCYTDLEDALRMAVHAVKCWGPSDVAHGIEAIEEYLETDISRGYVDLRLAMPPYGDFPQVRIVDWKTTGRLDAAWKARNVDGWQAMIYGDLVTRTSPGPVLVTVEFRGITRDLKTLAVTVPDAGAKDKQLAVARYLRDTAETITAFEAAHGRVNSPWPRVRHSCEAFGRVCPYRDVAEFPCYTFPPDAAPVTLFDGKVSYSSAELFWLCPERWRRRKMDDADGKTNLDADENSAFGNLFHAIIADAYLLLKELKPLTDDKESK